MVLWLHLVAQYGLHRYASELGKKIKWCAIGTLRDNKIRGWVGHCIWRWLNEILIIMSVVNKWFLLCLFPWEHHLSTDWVWTFSSLGEFPWLHPGHVSWCHVTGMQSSLPSFPFPHIHAILWFCLLCRLWTGNLNPSTWQTAAGMNRDVCVFVHLF